MSRSTTHAAAAILVIALLPTLGRTEEPAPPVKLTLAEAGPAKSAPLGMRAISERDKALELRDSGIVIATIGVIATVIGAGMLGATFCVDCASNTSAAAGAGLIGVGQLVAIAGFPIWASGQARANRATRARLSVSASGARLQF